MDLASNDAVTELASIESPILFDLGLRFRRGPRDWGRLAAFGAYDCIPFALDWKGYPLVLRTWGARSRQATAICRFNPQSGSTEVVCASAAELVRALALRRYSYVAHDELRRLLARSESDWSTLAEVERRLGGTGELNDLRAALEARQRAKRDRLSLEAEEELGRRLERQVLPGTHNAAFCDALDALDGIDEMSIPADEDLGPFAHVIRLLRVVMFEGSEPERIAWAHEALSAPWHHDGAWSFPSLAGSDGIDVGIDRTSAQWMAASLLARHPSDDPITVAAAAASTAGADTYDGVAHAEAASVLAAAGDHVRASAAMLTYIQFAGARGAALAEGTLPLLLATAEAAGFNPFARAIRNFAEGSQNTVGARPGGPTRLSDVIAKLACQTVTFTEAVLEALESRPHCSRFPDQHRRLLVETGVPSRNLHFLGSSLTLDPRDEAVGQASMDLLCIGYLAGQRLMFHRKTGVVYDVSGSVRSWVAEDLDDLYDRIAQALLDDAAA